MDYGSQRRRAGLALGLALGLGYSLSSNLINSIVLPGIPLYVPRPGILFLILAITMMFALLGMITAWPQESAPGIIVASVVGSVVSSAWILFNETSNRVMTFVVLFLVFLPRVFFYLPFSALVRWLISRLFAPQRTKVPPVRRLFPVFAAFLGVVIAGGFTLYPREVRQSLVRADEMIRLGLQASTNDDLPKPLQSVEGFLAKANGKYTFEVGSDPDVLPVQRPIVEYGESEPFIIVRFESGFRFGCVYSPPYIVPVCGNF